MSRRFYAGKDTLGNFKVRQSKPGADAKTTLLLTDLLFDSDYVPGKVVGSGTMTVPGRPFNALSIYNYAHGLGYAPDFVFAVAANRLTVSNTPYRWWWYATTTLIPPNVPRRVGNNNMDFQYIGPFLLYSKLTGVGGGEEGNMGWTMNWNSTNITVVNYCPNNTWEGATQTDPNFDCHLHVRWIAVQMF